MFTPSSDSPWMSSARLLFCSVLNHLLAWRGHSVNKESRILLYKTLNIETMNNKHNRAN